MLPVFLNLKFIKIYTQGLFLVLAFFWASYLLWKLIRLTSYKEEEVFDSLFTGIFSGLFIGRLLYVMLNFSKFGFDPIKFILVNGYPGFSIVGGLAGFILAIYLLSKKQKVSFNEIIDYFIPPIFLALGFGKLGSFFSGSELGSKTKFIISLKYPGLTGNYHLTAFYEAFLFFCGFYLAYKILMAIRKEQGRKGLNWYFFIAWFGGVYFWFDKLKNNHLYFQNWSFNQTIGLLLHLTGVLYFLYYFRRQTIEKIKNIINPITKYVKKNISKIYQGTKSRFGKGKEKDSRSNP